MTVARSCLLGSLVVALCLGLAGAADALPIPGGASGSDPDLALGDGGGAAAMGLEVPVVDPPTGGPLNVEELDGFKTISISHPNASKLGFQDPFISLQIRPGSGPDTVTFLAKPPATIPEPSTLALFGIAGLIGLAGRKCTRS